MALCFQTNTYMEPTFRALLGSSTEEWTIWQRRRVLGPIC